MKIYESDEHIVLAKKDIKECLNALIIGGAEDKELFDYLSEEYSYLLKEVEELDLKDDDLICLSFSPMSGSYLLNMDSLDEVLESIKENEDYNTIVNDINIICSSVICEFITAFEHNKQQSRFISYNEVTKKVERQLRDGHKEITDDEMRLLFGGQISYCLRNYQSNLLENKIPLKSFVIR